ncbi:hypothetical protein TrispH2_006571 [Trichoplax sp. H2]|nr:hypothetical protein TrispH2_006571 [Trichoplax sp. H2]|eukprot:RDD42764.1 hypothetical protein TrispH2_006571 [Trichoplax sp. H2]
MDVFRSICNYVLRWGHHTLWVNRLDGKFTLKEDIDVHDVSDLEHVGSIDAYIGRIRFFHGK